MRVAFCGGGTGGHVYPALTVAAALRQLVPDGLALLYVGVRGRIDADLVEREGIDFAAVTALPLRVGNVVGTSRGALAAAVGASQAVAVLRRFRPDVVFATGGYGSVGVALAAKMLRKPVLLFLPDVEAGMAVKAIAKFADRVAVSVEPALAALPAGRAVVTGYPVRASFHDLDREVARRELGLHPALPTVLVSGASSGASRLNESVLAWAPDFLRVGQMVHLSGLREEAALRARVDDLPSELGERYHLHGYLHEPAAAYAAADLGVMRAGASVLGELPAACLPAILVPGEYEGGYDQFANARYLESQGAAVLLPQARLDELPTKMMDLLRDTETRDRMKAALAGLARPDAAERIARIVIDLAPARVSAAA